MMTEIWAGLTILACLLLAAMLSVLETFFLRVPAADLLPENHPRHKLARALLRHQDSVISALQFGYVLVMMALAAVLAFVLFRETAGLYAAGIGLLLVMPVYFVTRALPQSYAMKQPPEKILSFLPVMRFCFYLFLLPVSTVAWLAGQVTHVWKNHFHYRPHLFNTDEWRNLVARSEGVDAKKDKAMHQAMQSMYDLTLQDVMQPAESVQMIDGDMPIEEMVDALLESHEQRVVMVQDGPQNIVGILHMNLFLKAVALAGGDVNAVDLSSAISEPLFVSPYTSVIDQLHDFRSHGQHFALVRDRQQNMIGAVSDELLVNAVTTSLLHQ